MCRVVVESSSKSSSKTIPAKGHKKTKNPQTVDVSTFVHFGV
jgi:hypothetical protein